MESVYSVVRTGSLTKAVCASSLKGSCLLILAFTVVTSVLFSFVGFFLSVFIYFVFGIFNDNVVLNTQHRQSVTYRNLELILCVRT
jgi:hypothetical protein